MSNKRTFWTTWAACLFVIGISLILLYSGYIDYGIALFCILPACVGLFTGFFPRRTLAIAGMLAALACILVILLTGQLEGIICIIMALPIVGVFVLIGYVIGLIIKYYTKKKDEFKLSFFPLVILSLALLTNKAWSGNGEDTAVTTSVFLKASPHEIYDHIKHVDTVTIAPHWFHDLGLPYPYNCIMTAEKIGGKRICGFDAGTITETIVELKKDELLRMEVSEYDLPGKAWFTFKEDSYWIKEENGGSRITRITTYHSNLKPRLYWKEIERLTIGTQQDIVFDNLKNELEK